MKKNFTITYKKQVIQVESSEKNVYNLKYPDFKYLMLDNNEQGWVVEDRSGDYWTDEDIKAISGLIEKNEPATSKDEVEEESPFPGEE
jgi:hypothetical protein